MIAYFYSTHVADLASQSLPQGCVPSDVKQTYFALTMMEVSVPNSLLVGWLG